MSREKNIRERQLIIERIIRLQPEIVEIGVESLAIFGSIAKANQSELSDLDVLVNGVNPQNKSRLLKLLSRTTNRPIELIAFEELQAPHKKEILEIRIDVFSLD